MRSFCGISFVCIFYMFLSTAICADDKVTQRNETNSGTMVPKFASFTAKPLEESLVKNVKTLARLVGRVSELEKEMRFVEKTVFGEALNSVSENTVDRPSEVHEVIASVSRAEGGGFKFMLEHDFVNIINVQWAYDHIFVPESMAKQTRLPGKDVIVIPSNFLQTTAEFRLAQIYIETDDIIFLFSWFINVTSLAPNGEAISQSVQVSTPTISPSRNIGYLPGEKIELRISGRHTNYSRITWHFASVSDDPDDDVAIIYNSYMNSGFVDISLDSEDDSTIIAKINSTLLSNGGVIFLREWMDIPGDVFNEYHIVQTIYLHLKTRKDPIPFNRVALEMEYLSSQHISLEIPESQLACVAYGNPTPQMEFREDGRRMDLEYSDWPWEYGNQISALVTSDVLDHNISCYAKSGDDDVNWEIILTTPLRWVEEESTITRISDQVIEVTCTIQGKPLPDIKFYYGSEWGRTSLNEDMDNVEIASAKHGRTLTSKLILDTSNIMDLYQITCAAERDYEETSKFFAIPEV